jgi:branched-chain amino acid aminotransferase
MATSAKNGLNIFVVRGGEVLTPREKFVLPGASRQTVIDLAKAEGIPFAEADLTTMLTMPRRSF